MSKAPIFKGCTRPAMLFGVPLLPMILTLGGALLGSVWLGYLVAWWAAVAVFVISTVAIVTMRDITKKDDQRLKQVLMRLGIRMRQRNYRRWGAITFSPIRYKGKK